MNAQEFFYISVGITVWLILGIYIFVAYKITSTLKTIRETLKSYGEIKRDAAIFGKTAKLGALTILSKILGGIVKGGDKNG